MKYVKSINFVLFSILFALNGESAVASQLKIANVDRLIDISSQIVKVANKITFQNAGTEPVSHFIFTVDPKFVDNVAVIKARGSDSDASLAVDEAKHDNRKAWSIKFDKPLEGGKFSTVDVSYSLIDHLRPYPTQITQNEKQYVKFIGNCHVYAPYTITKSTTTIALGTKNVESYTRVDHVSFTDSHILYGPFKDLKPYASGDIEIHYENNSPFLIATELHRQIEISHWGNIAVEDEITLEHTGAKLKGPFSRYDYQREPDSGSSSVKSFKTVLPATASNIYYRDEIGNISTSHLYIMENSVDVELRPRFPLFGGWNTRYTLGYNVPSYTYLYTKGDNYLLKMPFIDHIFDNMVIREATVRIILPEGSHSIDLNTPFKMERLPDTLHYTYLDTIGRPVVTIKKNNLVEDHIEHFELRYIFPKMYMLLEPLLLIGFLFILFVTVIIYVRLDFSLSRDESAEQKLRISGLCGKLLAYHDKRMKLYQIFEEKLSSVKRNKDVNALNAAIKSFGIDYKNISSQISEFSVKLKNECPELYEKSSEISKLDKQLKDAFTQHQVVYIEKLLPGKITKEAFITLETNFTKKKEELAGKINKLLKGVE